MTPTLVAFSCGAGVQSAAIGLLVRDGQLPVPDHVIFADTGWEPAQVYRQVGRLEKLFCDLGATFHRVSQGHLRNDALDPERRSASVPYYIRNSDGSEGMGRRQCTAEYKLAPINRKVRELLGARPPQFRSVPRGRVAEQWIGFSTDEIERVSPNGHQVLYQRPRYPLLDLGLSRGHCEGLLAAAGWGDVVKSACIGCPFHGNRAWRELRDQRPQEWADAVAFDHSIRRGIARGVPLDGQAYLHRSRIPLELAPIDYVTRAERHENAMVGQGSLLDEDGHPDGCSPYGCSSGEPVTDNTGAGR